MWNGVSGGGGAGDEEAARHQGSDELCIPAADKFAWAFRGQCSQFVNPAAIDFRN